MANGKSEGGLVLDHKRRELQSSIKLANQVGWPTLAVTAVLLMIAAAFVGYVTLRVCTKGLLG